MSQRLLLPFGRQMMLCGYKNSEYVMHWGYDHYGIDLSSIQGGAGTDAHVYASGEGKVLAAGRDRDLGCGLAVLYADCESREGEIRSLTVRYMHLTSIAVKAGDAVRRGDILGIEGKEGTADHHLHLEMDTDTRKKYACWTPQVSPGLTFWKRGEDSTVNPSLWLWQSPERAIVEPTYNPAWLNREDLEFPWIFGGEEAANAELLRLKKAIDAYELEKVAILNGLRALIERLEG